jgi:hypothetical protein
MHTDKNGGRDQQFSLCRWQTGMSPVVIARSDSDAAILFILLLGIASSLPLLAMTTGFVGPVSQNENCWDATVLVARVLIAK